LHPGLHPDRPSPTAEQALGGAVGDAVHLALGTLGRLAGDETVIAGVAGLVDIEEGDDVALLHGVAPDVHHAACSCLDDADRDVPGDDWELDAELSVMKVNVGTADLGVKRSEEGGAGCEDG